MAALRQRAEDYAPGDTDLAWTRTTPWRSLLAGALDTADAPVTAATVTADRTDPTARAAARLAAGPARHHADRPRPAANAIAGASTLRLADGEEISIDRATAIGRAAAGPACPTGPCRWPAASSATSWPRSCAASTPTSRTRPRWRRPPASPGSTTGPAPRVHIWHDPAPAGRAARGTVPGVAARPDEARPA